VNIDAGPKRTVEILALNPLYDFFNRKKIGAVGPFTVEQKRGVSNLQSGAQGDGHKNLFDNYITIN
jgi:hypothetical protein